MLHHAYNVAFVAFVSLVMMMYLWKKNPANLLWENRCTVVILFSRSEYSLSFGMNRYNRRLPACRRRREFLRLTFMLWCTPWHFLTTPSWPVNLSMIWSTQFAGHQSSHTIVMTDLKLSRIWTRQLHSYGFPASRGSFPQYGGCCILKYFLFFTLDIRNKRIVDKHAIFFSIIIKYV